MRDGNCKYRTGIGKPGAPARPPPCRPRKRTSGEPMQPSPGVVPVVRTRRDAQWTPVSRVPVVPPAPTSERVQQSDTIKSPVHRAPRHLEWPCNRVGPFPLLYPLAGMGHLLRYQSRLAAHWHAFAWALPFARLGRSPRFVRGASADGSRPRTGKGTCPIPTVSPL